MSEQSKQVSLSSSNWSSTPSRNKDVDEIEPWRTKVPTLRGLEEDAIRAGQLLHFIEWQRKAAETETVYLTSLVHREEGSNNTTTSELRKKQRESELRDLRKWETIQTIREQRLRQDNENAQSSGLYYILGTYQHAWKDYMDDVLDEMEMDDLKGLCRKMAEALVDYMHTKTKLEVDFDYVLEEWLLEEMDSYDLYPWYLPRRKCQSGEDTGGSGSSNKKRKAEEGQTEGGPSRKQRKD